jgi:hypothetical protein
MMANLTLTSAIRYVINQEAAWEDYQHLGVNGCWQSDEDGTPTIEISTYGIYGDQPPTTNRWAVWIADGQLYGEC